mgnify:CR=1 FL=1
MNPIEPAKYSDKNYKVNFKVTTPEDQIVGFTIQIYKVKEDLHIVEFLKSAGNILEFNT